MVYKMISHKLYLILTVTIEVDIFRILQMKKLRFGNVK